MGNILIIKTGAAGDVVRTTSLLNVLNGNVYWVTDSKNSPLLPGLDHLVTFTIDEAFQSINRIRFDQVISLEEDLDCGRLASLARAKELYGLYLDNNDVINYTDNSASWFDMSRVSKLGLTKANQLKSENMDSYQFHIFKMIGKRFNGEPYQIFTNPLVKTGKNLIGIETRTGKQWPDKQWWGYDELIRQLEGEGIASKILKQRNNLRDYLGDIAECSHIVSGDTLGMHVALAYRKTCTAIFNCTSPQEIYDYGLLKKVVSPLLPKYFYSSAIDREVIDSIPVEDVYRTLPIA
jgi:heptosyltransferase II